jgi:hypothetical protein
LLQPKLILVTPITLLLKLNETYLGLVIILQELQSINRVKVSEVMQ